MTPTVLLLVLGAVLAACGLWRAGLLSGAAGLAAAAVAALTLPGSPTFRTPSPLPGLDFTFGLDPLSRLFLLLTSLVGVAVSLYSLGYLNPYGPRRSRAFAAALQLLFLDLGAVFLARDLISFLFAWGLMGLLSYLLLTLEPEHPDAPAAAYLMTAMTEVGSGLLLLAFLLLAFHAHAVSFAALAAASGSLAPAWRDLAFVLFLLGFGVKIGVFPLGIWLPRAHPAGPANFSALLSGVLVAAGLYGLWRSVVLLLGPGPAWWGGLILALGVVTALLGVLYALLSRELKQILAYSTLENMGIVLAAWGAALLFAEAHLPSLAALAALAGFIHLFNHGLFKGLLFLGAGSVDRATGVQVVDLLGGLARRLPLTAPAFFLGALAIAGLPPLNGFPGEWLTLESFMQAFALPSADLRLLLVLAAALLALTAGLAVTLFVKLFGVAFLGLPRSRQAERAREPSGWMAAGLVLLAMACLAAGAFPTALVVRFAPVVGVPFGTLAAGIAPPVFAEPHKFQLLWSLGGGLFSWLPLPGLVLAPTPTFSSTAPFLLGLALVVGMLLAWRLTRLGRYRSREVPAWNGGYLPPAALFQYTAFGYAGPVRTLVRGMLGVSSELAPPEAAGTPARHRYDVRALQEELLYRPVARTVLRLARGLQRIHTGSLGLYLAWLLLAVLLALAVAAGYR
jgi:hydrogenase-4 component B